jgi:hypothetical protein
MKRALTIMIALAPPLMSFEESPWLNFPYEVHFSSAVDQSYYASLAGDHSQTNRYENSWNTQLNLNLSVATLSLYDVEVEGEFFSTSATSFTLESAAIQMRKQILDDIQGDVVSLTLGANLRFVPTHALKDPYVPYQGLLNLEVSGSMGKEFDNGSDWIRRFYVLIAPGVANRGAFYLRADGRFDWHQKSHTVGVLLNSLLGFGNTHTVDWSNFQGYGQIWHQAIDLGVIYTYHFDLYGALSFALTYRPYAMNVPRHLTRGEIRYELPFSVF